MKFTTEDEIRDYYRNYAYEVGFGVTKRSSRKQNGIHYFTLGCSRYGNYESSSSNPRPTTKSNCQARINVKVTREGVCEISNVVLDHTHPVSPGKSRRFQCNKKLDMHARRSLEINDAAGIRKNKNFSSLVQEAGGHDNLEFGYDEARSYVRKTRLELGTGDANALQQYFCRMQQKNDAFFFAMDINDEGRLVNVFWADARCRAAYEDFSDVVTFDSTYLTNRYDMPFAPFVGVNHHGYSILLGCALLSNEDTSTYIWLFRVWLDCMSGRAPQGIITDQCLAMKEAISVLFPNTRHRLCLWHIMRKIPTKLSSHGNYRAVKKTMKSIVYESLYEDQFESKWEAMIEEFGLQRNSWLLDLYGLRRYWAPVFLKRQFWTGMSTTQRSESMNAFFDGYVNSKTSLKNFVKEYDNALRDKVEKDNRADFMCFSKTLPLVTSLHIEKQFAAVYTHEILKKFQNELKGLSYCNVQFVAQSLNIEFTFQVTDTSSLGKDAITRRKRVFHVHINQFHETIDCECSFFMFKGIVCRHMIAAMNFHQMNMIPEKYILQRWRKDIKRRYTLIQSSFDDSTITPEMQRYDDLTKYTREINEVVSYSVERLSEKRKGKAIWSRVIYHG